MKQFENEFENYMIKNIIINVKDNVFNLKHNNKCVFHVINNENPVNALKRDFPEIYKKEYDDFFDMVHPY